MPRIIIGAGAGYLLALFFMATVFSGQDGFGTWYSLVKIALFQMAQGFVLVCIAVGAVMGWAWNRLATEKHSPASRTQVNDRANVEKHGYEPQRQEPQYNWKK